PRGVYCPENYSGTQFGHDICFKKTHTHNFISRAVVICANTCLPVLLACPISVSYW
uniref:Uncharacterized protein n=1 Tax=Sinocyclocheilus rhinocerous TaxID=307959 RepID=A0A673L629_9TELE